MFQVFIAALHTEDAKPHLIFARFTEGHHFSIDNTPARFAAFLIGPATSSISYRELGRCLCDLLSNPVWTKVLPAISSLRVMFSLLLGLPTRHHTGKISRGSYFWYRPDS